MNTVAIVQARMTSTRLPGKVLLDVMDRSMLSYQLERVSRVTAIDRIVIATTTNATDDPVAHFAETGGFGLYRGSENDVLGRFQAAAEAHVADTVVRLTADCPLADPEVIDLLIRRYREAAPACDYATNGIPRSYPAGLDAEIFSRSVLEIAAREATDPYDREHVTPFLYRNPQRFRLLSVVHEPDLSEERWTLDEPGDFALIRRIIEALYPENPEFRMADVIALLDLHPDWRELNRGVQEKPRVVEHTVFKGD